MSRGFPKFLFCRASRAADRAPNALLRLAQKASPTRTCIARLLFAVVTFGFAAAAVAQTTFTASLDRNTIYVGERAILSLTFQNRAPTTPPALPQLPQLRFDYIGPETRFVLRNQHQEHTTTFKYSVTPTSIGEFVIPSIQAVVDGRTLSSQPLRLRVLKADSSAAGSSPQAAFLRLIVPKTKAYVGEHFQVEIQLFLQNASDIQMPQLRGDGFTIGPLAQIGRTQAQVGQGVYQVYVFRTTVSAAKSGSLTLGPAECELVLRIRKPTNPRDPFAEFFGGGYELRPARLASESESIQVLPLPEEDRPTDFDGAVGDYSLSVTANPTNVTVGDPITLKVQIAGRGALDSVSLPEQNWPEFKRYQPTSKIESTGEHGLTGIKTFEQAVAPLNASVTELPAVRFSFFDPEKEAYRTIEHPPIPIEVRPNPTGSPQLALSAIPDEVPEETGPQLAHIKPQLGTIAEAGAPLVVRSWFVALHAIPLAVLVAAFGWRKYQEHLAGNPRLRRRQRIGRLTRRGLDQLGALASANDAEPFFATVFRLLQENLGEALDLPASAITESVLDERLRNQGAPDELVNALHELFQLCNQARYAPQRSSQELMSLVPRVETTLRHLSDFSRSDANIQKIAALLAILCAGSLSVRAQALDPNAMFDLANQLYERGEYGKAAAGYRKLIESGTTSVAVYFNYGNALLRSGQTGGAILSFRQAEQLEPRDPDVQANLRYARAQVSGAAPKSGTWKRWVQILTLNELTVLFSIAYWTWMGLLITATLRENARRPQALRATGIATAVFGLWLAVAFSTVRSAGQAVVVAPEAVARYGPVDESQSHFTLPNGAELKILDRKEQWLQIRDSQGRTGWVRADKTARTVQELEPRPSRTQSPS